MTLQDQVALTFVTHDQQQYKIQNGAPAGLPE